MQLGNILSTAAEPVATRIVEFQVLAQMPDGRQGKAIAKAALAFVSEAARQDARRSAVENLSRGGDLDEEENYWLLLAALRDADNPVAQFCPNTDIAKFKAAIIVHQVRWLLREYRRFVEDEYPELLTPEQKKQIEDEARGNS